MRLDPVPRKVQAERKPFGPSFHYRRNGQRVCSRSLAPPSLGQQDCQDRQDKTLSVGGLCMNKCHQTVPEKGPGLAAHSEDRRNSVLRSWGRATKVKNSEPLCQLAWFSLPIRVYEVQVEVSRHSPKPRINDTHSSIACESNTVSMERAVNI